jgi:hypothetical protein
LLGKPKGRTVDSLQRPKQEKREEGQIARGGNTGSATEPIGLHWYTSCPLLQPPRKINAILARLLHIHSWAIFPVVAVPFNDSITEIADPTSLPAFVPDCVPHKAPEAQCLDLTLFPLKIYIDLIL